MRAISRDAKNMQWNKKVDHVGGIGKTTLRRAIAGGKVFDSNKLIPDMVEYLQQKFSDNRQPRYEVIELQCQETEAARQESRRYVFGTIDGTSAFRSVYSLQTKFNEN